MNYYKLSFDLKNHTEIADILSYELGEIGFESFDENENYFNAYIQSKLFDEKKVKEYCENYKGKLNLSFKIELIPQQNWNAIWESNYQAIEISNILRIRANFHEFKPGFENEIVINPKMSFGTGHHETTQLVVQTMHRLDFKNKTILDMGCGTGILAIYACKLGANKIHAIDIEDFAYENCLENCQLNNTQTILVEKGGLEKIPSLNFNIILANINKNILLQQLGSYSNHLTKSGNLILSGFFDSDCDELINASLTTGMEFVSKHTNNNWACLHLRKN